MRTHGRGMCATSPRTSGRWYGTGAVTGGTGSPHGTYRSATTCPVRSTTPKSYPSSRARSMIWPTASTVAAPAGVSMGPSCSPTMTPGASLAPMPSRMAAAVMSGRQSAASMRFRKDV